MNCYNLSMNNHYIYVWKESRVAGSGIPFYVGQGKYQPNRYSRAYSKHKGGKCGAYCQNRANKLAKLGTPHVVEILYDGISKAEANRLEVLLISRLGRISNGSGILTNLSDGGDSNPMDILEIRQKQLKYMKSLENRIRASEHLKKLWTNKEYRESQILMNKLGNINEDRKISIEVEGVQYTSIHEAGISLGIKTETLRKRLNKNLPLNKDSSYYNPIVYNGIEYRNCSELARVFNINYNTLKTRIRNGLSVEDAVNKGIQNGRN